jgi:peptidoglycan/LPS O-acetylase OafA/YrhL
MRIAGFDFLRGLCAIAVALYHMLSWSGTATFHSWGLYGVYIFFVLSGASMAVAYRDRFANGFTPSEFLLLRFARIAPLFLLVIAAKLVLHPSENNVAQNVSLLFGLGNPGANSLAVGGWSIGIEFAYYLMFPLLLSISQSRGRWYIALLISVAQLAFVNQVLATGTLEKVWTAYTQPLAFMAYFYIGCLIGGRALDGNISKNSEIPFAAVLASILAGGADSGEATLAGARGVMLFLLALLAVHFAVGLAVPRRLASFLGQVSYGTYLFHPFAYYGIVKLGAPIAATIAASLAVSVAGAYASHRFYEVRVRDWIKRRLPVKAAHGTVGILAPEPTAPRDTSLSGTSR